MKDQNKTKSQLIEELCELRHRVALLSARQRAEQDLRVEEWAGEQLYRALVERIDAVFWISTPGVSKQIYVSPSYEKIWGRPLEEVLRVPRAFVDSIHPDDKKRFLSTLLKYHAHGKPYEQEYRIIRPDKEVIWIHERGYPLRAKRGGPKLMLGICTNVTKQKESESQLRENEKRLSRAQEIARIGDWEWDVVSGEVYWSKEVFRIFKLPRQKPSFQLTLSVVHPEDLAQWENAIHDAVKTAKPIRMDYRVLRPDSSVRWVHLESDVQTDAAGKTACLVGTLQDITARKKAERALAVSEQRYRTVTEHIPVAVYSASPARTGMPKFITGKIADLTGFSRREHLTVEGLFDRMLHPEDRERVRRASKEQSRNPAPLDIDYRIITKTGKERWIHDRVVPALDAKGKMFRVDGFMEDVTARKNAEEALLMRVNELTCLHRVHIDIQREVSLEQLCRRIIGHLGEALKVTCVVVEIELKGKRFRSKGSTSGMDCGLRLEVVAEGETFGELRVYCARDQCPSSPEEIQLLRSVADALGLWITRKRVQTELEEKERELTLTLDATTEGIWNWDFTTNRLSFSPRYYQMLGYEPDEFPASYEAWADLIHPKDRQRAFVVAERYLADKPDTYRNEFRLRTKAGDYKWIRAEARVVARDRNGRALRMIGNHRDITAEKLAESRLALFKTVVDSSKIGIAISDPEGRLIYINPAHERLFGRSLKEACNLNYRAFYPAEAVAALDSEVAPALARGKDWEGVLDAVDARGRRFPLWARASTVRDAQDNMICAFGFMQDDTERQAAAKALAASEAQYHSLVESSAAGIATLDAEGRFTFANRRSCQMVGVPDGGLIGRMFVDFLHPDDKGRILGAFARRHQDPHVERNLEFRIVRKDSKTLQCLAAVTAIRDGKAIAGFNAIVQDVTELKRTQEALRQSELKLRSLFNNSEVGMFRTRLDGSEVLDANEKFLGILSRKRGEVIGSQSLIYWADSRDRERLVSRLKNDERAVDFECRLLRKSGEVRICLTSLSLNRKEGILDGSILDITEHRKAEDTLRENEKKYRTLFENMAEGAFYQMADGKVVDCNKAVLMMFGLTRGQFLGRTSMDPRWNVIHEDGSEFPGNRHPSMEALQTGKPVRNVVAAVFNPRKKDYVWLSITAIPEFRPGKDKPYQVFVTLHDITHHKRLEKEIARQRDRARLYLDIAGVMLITLDRAGKVTLINRKGCEILGHDRDEIIGKDWVENFVPERLRE